MNSRKLIKEDFTTNTTLEAEAKRLKLPLKYAWYKDELPSKRPLKNGGYIVNLASSNNPGTHWVLLFKEGDKHVYFDSFGFPPPVEVLECIPDKYLYNSQVIQHPLDGGCGSYSLEALQYLWENRRKQPDIKQRFQDFLNLFHEDFSRNRRVLRRLELD